MLPVATCTVDVDRPTAAADPDEAGTIERLFTALPANVSAPSGSDLVAGGAQEIVDAVLYVPVTDPAVVRGDVVTHNLTGDTWRVTWCRRRTGLGLDHQQAGLRSVRGSASG